jgi:predicted transcriptional regulator
MIMQNMIKGGTIQGILAKETQENYILYMREIDSNIYINKSYVIAMADIESQKQLKKDLEILKEGPMNEEELLNHCSPELKKDWVLRYLDYLKKQEKIQKRDDKLKLTDKGRKWLKS